MGVSVNCWFCNEDSQVPAYSRNGWECPKCDQYNGFTADGDIALPVSASAGRRNVRYNVLVQPRAEPAWQLCHRCNQNQALKARQLAEFRPMVDENWEAELDEYAQHLERVYDTCAFCKTVVARALREKDDLVRPGWLAWLRGLQERRRAQKGERRAPREATGRLEKVLVVGRRALMLLLNVGLGLLFLLLVNNRLLALSGTEVSEGHSVTLHGADELFVESKAALALSCFVLWVLVVEPRFELQTLWMALLWIIFFFVEMMTDSHIEEGNAITFEIEVVFGLLYLSLKRPRVDHAKALEASVVNVAGVSPFRSPIPSSTPKSSPSIVANGSPPPSNGHAPAASSDYGPAQDDYNLPTLSLGSPRKGAASPGVFALRTYRPAADALFAPARRLLSPPRLRGELHHSAWIAGGYWQRGRPGAEPAHPLSRSSSQSSGFVDTGGGSVLGDEWPSPPPAGWAAEPEPVGARVDCPWEARSCVSSQGDWRSCSASRRELPACAGVQHDARGCAGFAHDASSQLSARSFGSSQTTDSSLLGMAASHKNVLVALVLGFSVAFNMFAVMLLVFRDRL